MHSDAPLGHIEMLEKLWQAAVRNRLGHALLFQGPRGIGKFRAAEYFALGLLCEKGPGRPCCLCGPCKRALAGSHPGLYVLDPGALELESIPVKYISPRQGEKVLSIEEFLALRSAEGTYRVVIIRDFDLANESSQNALLKTLEEPGESVVIVLETSRPERLLETIHSRCVCARLEPLEMAQALEVCAHEGLVGRDAERLVRLSGGAPGRALELNKRAGLMMLETLGALLKSGGDSLGAAETLCTLEGDFPGKTASAQSRLRTRQLLDLGLELLRDLGRLAQGVPPEQLSLGEFVTGLPSRPSSRAIGDAVDVWLRGRQDVDLNMRPEAIVDRALLAFAAIAPPKVPLEQ